MTTPPAPLWLATVRAFRDRPSLTTALAFGGAMAIGLYGPPNDLNWITRNILIWDSAALTFIVLTLQTMRRCGIDDIQARSAAQDEGRGLTLTLSVLSAALSVFAIAAQLSLAKSDHGLVKVARVSLAFLTIAVSWLFTHLIFALHYAHEYYSPETCTDSEGRIERGGLWFPGDEAPDYWDFLHFAVIIGVACQTADIEFRSKPQRRIGTVHGVLSFVFNTVVLALTINLLAGLF